MNQNGESAPERVVRAPEAGPVSGVVLAAGRSRRFGGSVPKQLFEIEGEPLVRRVTRRALESDLSEVVVVVGHRGAAVGEAVSGLAARVVENRSYREGQSTSVRAGLAAVDPGAVAVIFLPIDQPFLDAEILGRILAAYRRTGGPIVVPSYQGRRGAPVLFGRALFGELDRIRGDAGGRQLFAAHEDEIHLAELDDPSPLLDLDLPESLPRLLGQRSRRVDGIRG